MKKIARILAALVLCASAALAHADYPDHALRLIVPYPPGGNIDATARIVANGLGAVLGQSVIVDNRAGASGMVGAEAVANSAPDGYTLLLASSGALAPLKAFNPALRLDFERDFTPAGSIARTPMLLVLRRDLPATTLAEFIAYAKARPGKLTMASAGTGGNAHLTGELFQLRSGTKFLHVPYKGASQSLADLLGGQVDLTFAPPVGILEQVSAGKLRVLGVTSAKRFGAAPELPTLAESGLPGFDASTTTGLMFAAHTPAAIVAKVNAALRQVLRQPDTHNRFETLGSDVVEGSGEDFAQTVRNEVSQWTRVVHDADL
ncbi:MAG: tripartite tricarboxylate transporter substrate binding protein, partial [Pseudomonadota bacterium]